MCELKLKKVLEFDDDLSDEALDRDPIPAGRCALCLAGTAYSALCTAPEEAQ